MKRKRSFDWHAAQQRFSIRKYHFGAASVLLGISLAVGVNAQAETTVAETTTPATEAVTVAETTVAPATEAPAVVDTTVAPATEAPAVAETTVISAPETTVAETTVPATETTVAETTAPATETTVAETTAPATETTVAATTTPATETTTRTAQIAYKVVYQDVDTAKVYSPTPVRYAAVDTTDAIATTSVTVSADNIPTDFELVPAQSAKITQTVVEGTKNLLVFAIRRKTTPTVTTDAVAASGDGVSGFRLAPEGTTASLDAVAKSEGVLLDSNTTASPDMSDPNGASVSTPVESTYVPTTTDGYLTVDYTPLAFYDAMTASYAKYTDGGSKPTGGAYFRTSVQKGDISQPLLVELVSKDGQVLETQTLAAGTTAEFTYFKSTSGIDAPFVVKYRTEYASDTILGNTLFSFDSNTMEFSRAIPKPVEVSTYYKTDTSDLAKFTIQTLPGVTTTPSGVRDFAGYEYVKTTTETLPVPVYASDPYVDYTRANFNGLGHKTIVTPVGTDGTVVKDFYIADLKNSTTQDYDSLSTDGFIHLLTTNEMAPGTSNTTNTLDPALLTSGYKIYIVDASKSDQVNNWVIPPGGTLVTDVSQLAFSNLTTTSHWFHIVINENPQIGELGFTRVRFGNVNDPSRIQLQYSVKADPTKDINKETGVPLTFVGTNIGFALNNVPKYTVTETTYWYAAIPQSAKIIISTVDANEQNKTEFATVTETDGKINETIPTTNTQDVLNELKRQGYDVVTPVYDDFLDSTKVYDGIAEDTTTGEPSQVFEIVVKERIVDVPKDPKPGEPVDPTDPNSPVWPDTVSNLKRTEEVTRTITYVNEAGEEVAQPFTETITFERTAKVNLVTGEIIYGEWTATNSDDTLSGNPLPTPAGYLVDRATNAGTAVDPSTTTTEATVTADSADIVEQVIYVATGSVVINYVDTDGNVIQAPVTDESGVKVGTAYNTTDEGDKPTTITTADGTKYVLVPSKTVGSETGTITAGTTQVTYVYQKVSSWIPQIPGVPTDELPKTPYPFDPNQPDSPIPGIPTVPGTTTPVVPYVPGYTPVDPKTNEPLKPVDPNDPNKGYIPPTPENPGEDTIIPYKELGSVVVNFVDTDGNVIKSPVTDTSNAVVGTAYDTTDNKPTTITTADGTKYVLVPSKTVGSETGSITGGTTQVTYVYQKVSSWIPQIPGVPTDELPKTPYPFDPNQPDSPIPGIPTVPGTTTPVVPYVPGYTPVDPKTNEPLKPVDPNDPNKGYIPPTPENPGEDTIIPYKELGSVVVNFVDTDGNVIKSPVTDTSNAVVGTAYDTTDNKPTTITTADGTKYVLVPSKTVGSETGSITGGTTQVTYVYQKVSSWIPQIPGVPTDELPKTPYPFDPNQPDSPIPGIPTVPGTTTPVVPYVPGYTPVDPKTNEPLKPVDPNDPNKGYIPPTPENPGEDTIIPYKELGSVVVNFVDTDGNVIKSPVTDTSNAVVGTAYDTTDNKPTTITTADGTKYVLVPSKTVGSETGSITGGTTQVTYVYQKVSSWIPQIPGVPTDELPKTPYPFDPNQPDSPIPGIPTVPGTTTPVVPYVPGYTPVDPKTNEPLKPVDPNDPNKGYIPPTPENPGEDTIIPYKELGSVVVNFVDTDGNVIKSPVTDTSNAVVGTAYDTTDNKPTTITTADGTKYVLVPSKTVGSETGSITGGTTQVTYVYQKVSSWIPQIPGVPTDELPKTPYPFDPNQPDSPIPGIPTVPGTTTPVVPYVPGYTPVDPKTNEPLKPVDPNDPNKGYIPPTPENPGEDTFIPYKKLGSVVVNFVDTNGNVIKSPVTDTSNAVVGTAYDTTDNKPTTIITADGTKYVLVPSKTVGSETGSITAGTTQVTYVYQKVSSWIPQIPGVPADELPKTPYPFDPNQPDSPIPGIPTVPGTTTPVVPYVPGYTPVDPKTNEPLKPVDPNDPSKGYYPPTPENPGEDTIIPYVPNPAPTPEPTPTPDPTPAPKPTEPAKPAPAPVAPEAPQLPSTGETNSLAVSALGASILLATLGLAGKRRRREDEK